MRKNNKAYNGVILNYTERCPLSKFYIFLFLLFIWTAPAIGQEKKVVKGVVIDESQQPLIGVSIYFKGTSIRTMTNNEGKFTLDIPNDKVVLVAEYIGMAKQEIELKGRSDLRIVMKDDMALLNEVVVVGYGTQKKESVVGAITQTTGKVLERAGGVSSIGAALTGNVPGVITTASTGMPGEEDPQILIRGRSTWNNASPLILVDGVERPMTSVDISSVESISVLKDASATAVFGVRGANGVILITTKRGQEGKASIRGVVNTTAKVPSQLPGKYDSYDMLKLRNEVIEYELGTNPNGWADYVPQDIINKYRFPANLEESERYPNVDWADVLFKDYAMSQNANLNISGGTKFVKYFSSADILNEGDLFRKYDNNRGYEPGYGFKRLNVRSNLDFQITPSTLFKVNLSGSHATKKSPWNASGSEYGMWIAAYSNAPDAFLPRYSDGTWGYYSPDPSKAENSVRTLAMSGIEYVTTSRITTDFALEQKLDMITKGLKFNGSVSLDNTFVEGQRGVNDLYNDSQTKYIDPITGTPIYKLTFDPTTRFDFQEGVKWSSSAGGVRDWATYRRVFYQLQLNYAKTFAGKHDYTAMGLFNRNRSATGSVIPSYREDWVFRTTYTYDKKYSVEYNGAYNGSEKFSPENRFAFFSSGGIGWVVSEEQFMKSLTFVDRLKLRASYGEIGDDSGGGRFLYLTQWSYDGLARLGVTGEAAEQSPYRWYKESAVGNPNVHWEKVQKRNIGADFDFFKGLVSGSIDFFKDKRSEVLIAGSGRAIPSYYGAVAPVANLGKVESKGYEVDLKFNKKIDQVRLWANVNFTHAKNKILDADNAALLPDYQKSEGMQIGQSYSYVSHGYYNTWDQLYASTQHNTNDNEKIIGGYHIIDYNSDGIIDNRDNIPYGFSGSPQNTYNATLGFDWKGFGVFVQFYGVNNVTRQVVLGTFGNQNHVAYEEGSYWSKDNIDADVPMPRWLTMPNGYMVGNRYMFDGSYIRLKNAEISYTFDTQRSWIKKAGLSNVRVYVNGNNLWVKSKMPDDRESNFAGTGWASQGAYPTVKRFNLGAHVTF